MPKEHTGHLNSLNEEPRWGSQKSVHATFNVSKCCQPNHGTGVVISPQNRADEWTCPWQGVFHVEAKYTSRGPRLIEVNCRMGGGPVRTMNQLVWGVDLVEEHLLTAAGIPSRPPIHPRPQRPIAEFSVNAKKTGTLQHADFCGVSCPWSGPSGIALAG